MRQHQTDAGVGVAPQMLTPLPRYARDIIRLHEQTPPDVWEMAKTIATNSVYSIEEAVEFVTLSRREMPTPPLDKWNALTAWRIGFAKQVVARFCPPDPPSAATDADSGATCPKRNPNPLAFVTDGPCQREAGHDGPCDWIPAD